MALGQHGANALQESIEYGQAEAQQEVAEARRDLRSWHLAAQSAGDDISAKLEHSEVSSASVGAACAPAVPGKVALFDLAGGDLRFPSLDHRVKKKGFFGLW